MTSLVADNVSLTYRLKKRLSLAAPDRRLAVGGKLTGNGRAGEVAALSNVSFSLKAGERLGLIGHNGAGKTTLLKVLYGIFEPTSGSIERSGRIDALFNINLGFRSGATGRRNIELRGLINGWSKRHIDERMDEIIAFSRLGEFIDMPLSAYSQGMAARLAFATATSFHPEILLMDEWIGAGDRDFQVEANKRIDEMVTNAGIIVIASHNTAILKKICTHGLCLANGEAQFFGSIADALKFDDERHKAAAAARTA